MNAVDATITTVGVLAFAAAAVLTLVALVTLAVQVRALWRRRLWEAAFFIASEHPELLAEVASEEGWEGPAEQEVVALDAMGHTDLLDVAITRGEHIAQLEHDLEDTKSGADAQILAFRAEASKQTALAERASRAKRRHWKTITRMRREAAS